jgi:hypothetical protein
MSRKLKYIIRTLILKAQALKFLIYELLRYHLILEELVFAANGYVGVIRGHEDLNELQTRHKGLLKHKVQLVLDGRPLR